jgi:hypothetical protein
VWLGVGSWSGRVGAVAGLWPLLAEFACGELWWVSSCGGLEAESSWW